MKTEKEKIKKIELSKIIGYDVVIKRFQCFNPMWEEMYYFYLEKRGIELQYHNMNFMDFISNQQDSLLNIETNKEFFKRIDKKNKLQFIKECIYRGIAPLAVIACLIAVDDFEIHEKSNVINSYGIMKTIGYDYNNDGIDEINMEELDTMDKYSMPTDDKFYANSNPLYKLCNETEIADNISFMMAMKSINKEMIEIDGVKYSRTGFITEIHYVYNHERFVESTPRIFKNIEQVKKHLEEIHGEEKVNSFIITGVDKYSVKTLDEIPTINKNKETGKTNLQKSNQAYTKILKKTFDL